MLFDVVGNVLLMCLKMYRGVKPMADMQASQSLDPNAQIFDHLFAFHGIPPEYAFSQRRAPTAHFLLPAPEFGPGVLIF